MLLQILLVWALVTVASAVALVLFLAFDEWQVQVHAVPQEQADAGVQTTVSQPTPREGSPQAA